MSGAEQLAALARIHQLLDEQRIEYWLFGGWSVDFHAGAVTRAHDDLDLSVWAEDYDRVAAVDGRRMDARARGGRGRLHRLRTRRRPARAGVPRARRRRDRVHAAARRCRGAWPDKAFEDDIVELQGVRARVISLDALKADKSETRDDPVVAAKDGADVATLSSSDTA